MKNTFNMAMMIMLAWALLPSGPSDLLIIPTVIKWIGFPLYAALTAFVVWYLYKNIEGKTLKAKFRVVKLEVKRLF